ncbi:copper amine oxidase [Arenimonas caeni]|uniref:Copper amine oxidase n=1 Tax=Arenimonas caeni TaxID=2058085 RepID=A0A2P6MBJ5_9GAMM|nr:copper amine oxidase [Arenimonas caeni]
MTMHKDPNCECCSLWARHVEGAGFPVSVVADTHMDAFKRSVGVPAGKGSCHTAQVEGYFIEGHVPVEDIQRLLAERPDARGLAAPGMPIGSPGMPGPARPYTVYLIGKDGSSTPYSQHGH